MLNLCLPDLRLSLILCWLLFDLVRTQSAADTFIAESQIGGGTGPERGFDVVWIDGANHAQFVNFHDLDDAQHHYGNVPDQVAKLLRSGSTIIRHHDPDPYSLTDPDDDDDGVYPGLRSSFCSSRPNLSTYITSEQDLYRSAHDLHQISIDVLLITAPSMQDYGPDLSPRLRSLLLTMDHQHRLLSCLHEAGFTARNVFVVLPHDPESPLVWIFSDLRKADDIKFVDSDAAELKRALIQEDVEMEILSLSMAVPGDDHDASDRMYYEDKLVKQSPRRIMTMLSGRDPSLRPNAMTLSSFKTAKLGLIKVWDYLPPFSRDASSSRTSSSTLFSATPRSSIGSRSWSRSSASSQSLGSAYSFSEANLDFAHHEITITSRCRFHLDDEIGFLSHSTEIDAISEYVLPDHLACCQEIELLEVCSMKFSLQESQRSEFDFSASDDNLFTLQNMKTIVSDCHHGESALWSGLSDLGVSETGIVQSLVESVDRPPAVGYRSNFSVAGAIRPGLNSRMTFGTYYKASLFEAKAVAGPCVALARGPTIAVGAQASIAGLHAFVAAELCKAEVNVCGIGLGLGLNLHTGASIGLHKFALSLAGFGVAIGASCTVWTPIISITIL